MAPPRRPQSPPILGELKSLMDQHGFSYEPLVSQGFGESLYSISYKDQKIRETIVRSSIRDFINGWVMAIEHFGLREEFSEIDD